MFNKKFLKHYYIMLIPAIIWLVLFNIVPMVGIVMAFEDFNPGLGMWKSPFVGFANFEYMFQMSDIRQVMVNTIVIALGKIIANLIVPLVFAILLNELCIQKLYRPIQTIVYLPYFLSWVILAKIVLNIFGYVGPINSVINFFGGDSVNFFGMENMFRPLVIGTDIWKNFGYNAIIYLATMLGIAPELYEAAAVDGAGRFRRIWHITLPGIKMTVALLAILSLGNVLNAGFDQIFNLYNPLVYSTGDILDTWVYRPIQTIVYLPYFLSWVILAKIVLNIFGYVGPINSVINFFGGDSVNFFGMESMFRPLVIGTDIWKNFGYNAIIYLATMLGIAPELYEAAAVDGAGRFRRIWHITLPGIKMTVALLAILSLGNVLNAGFDQIFNLYNPLVYSTGDILDTWVYRAGLVNLQFSLATAVGLLKSVVSFVLITLGYWMADKFAGYKLF